jgi:hypothetical protein
MKEIAALLIDRTGVSVAECPRGLDQRFEHGLQVEGRVADHFQHVSHYGLLLQ